GSIACNGGHAVAQLCRRITPDATKGAIGTAVLEDKVLVMEQDLAVLARGKGAIHRQLTTLVAPDAEGGFGGVYLVLLPPVAQHYLLDHLDGCHVEACEVTVVTHQVALLTVRVR